LRLEGEPIPEPATVAAFVEVTYTLPDEK
jgi:hypothetical protein